MGMGRQLIDAPAKSLSNGSRLNELTLSRLCSLLSGAQFYKDINMNKLLIALLVSTVSISGYAAESKDDGAKLGTSNTPQVERQQRYTDKGPTDVNQNGVPNDASNLGNADSPQVKEQNKRTDKGSADPQFKKKKNKVLNNKDEKAGTTKGNPVQPTEYESAPPATTH
jgi:hypothetical protein